MKTPLVEYDVVFNSKAECTKRKVVQTCDATYCALLSMVRMMIWDMMCITSTNINAVIKATSSDESY